MFPCTVGVDLFPCCVVIHGIVSTHVETVVLLSHKKPDSVINVKVEFGEGEGKVPLDNIAKRAEAYKPKERVTSDGRENGSDKGALRYYQII